MVAERLQPPQRVVECVQQAVDRPLVAGRVRVVREDTPELVPRVDEERPLLDLVVVDPDELVV